MIEKCRNHFKRWNPKTFLWVSVLILLILDIGNGQFLRLSWLEKNTSMFIINIMTSSGQLSLNELSSETVTELLGMVNNTFLFFLFIILLNNLFFYCFTLLKKAWAHSYLVFYTMTGAFFSLFMVFDSFGMGSFWGFFNIISIIIYTYLFVGLKMVPLESSTSN